jgi:superfamily II DNA helicase RecQ
VKLTVINLPFDELAGFDAGPLEQFCDGHAVTAWVDHFFVHAGEPHLAVVVEYEERAERRRGQSPPRRERDPRKELPAASRPAYDRLREWRSLRARKDGVPVYVVFSNRELAAIAAAVPATKEALLAIEGIGKGKVDKYADDVFEVLTSLAEPAGNAAVEAPDDT